MLNEEFIRQAPTSGSLPFYFSSSNMKQHIAKYLEIARINSVQTMHHSINLFGRGTILLIRVWIFTQLYRATFAAQHADTINGLSLAMVVWSLIFVQGFNVASRPPVSRMIDEEVKTGTLAYSIGRPYIYTMFHYFGFLGRALPSLLTNVVLGAIIGLLLVGPIAIPLEAFGASVLLMLLGYTLDYLMSLTIGLAAFWLEDTSAMMWLYHKGFMIFGGAILPIALFPDRVRVFAEAMPFALLFYAPSRMLVRFDASLFVHYITMQCAWILLMATVVTFMYRKGVRYVSLNGG